MNKETLIRLATPASIFVLALSIFSVPIITKAQLGDWSGNPVYVKLVN